MFAEVFEKFRNISILQVCELAPACFLTSIGLWQAVLEKIKVKLELLTDIGMSLFVEKGVRGAIYHAIYQYVKANSKYLKNYNKNKESSYLKY